MAQRATSLGPKPSLLYLFCFLFFCFWFCFVFYFLGGGFKGQVRWPKWPPRLALNPPYVYCFFWFFFFVFLSLRLIEKPCFPPKKGHFDLFICVSLCFSLAFFGPHPFFPFSFFVSLSWSFHSSFVPVFHFCFWFLLFLSVYLLFLSSCSFVFLFFCLLSCLF